MLTATAATVAGAVAGAAGGMAAAADGLQLKWELRRASAECGGEFDGSDCSVAQLPVGDGGDGAVGFGLGDKVNVPALWLAVGAMG
jgi:hypothetical protein